MFEDYLLEEYGRETISTDEGFCTYVLNKEKAEVFMADLYIKPDSRTTIAAKKFFEMVKEIGRANHCEVITGLVSIGIQDDEKTRRKLKCFLGLGMQVWSANNNQLVIGMKL